MPMSETEEYARVLASTSRVEILKLLYKKTLSVEEIAKKLGLKPITVRHHLQYLSEAGLIEASEKREGSVGRPKVYYKATKAPQTFTFPKRYYQRLSRFLIDGLQLFIGEKKLKKFLTGIGMRMGESDVNQLKRKYNIEEWTPKDYIDLYIKEYLEESGAEPEIIEIKNDVVKYRLHNCLFFELASSMPEIMCDVLHESYHEGLSKAMGGMVTIKRETCMGKGDDYCEHTCQFKTVKSEKTSEG